MVAWLNRTIVAGPRNGTTSNTVPFAAASAGSLLVAVATGSVTSTTPTGWTLPAGGSAINNTGLYVWWKVATAGESSFTTTHNGSNYPVGFAVYEFPTGSTFVKSISAANATWNGANPSLTALTGTNLLMGVRARGIVSSPAAVGYVWSGTPTPTEDWDVFAAQVTTDGYESSLGYAEAATATSWAPVATYGLAIADPFEALTFAVKVAAGGGTNYTATPADAASVKDAVSRVLAAGRTLGDAASGKDAVVRAIAAVRADDDPVGLSDAVAVQLGRSASADDDLTMSDTVLVERGTGFLGYEPLALSDSALSAFAAARGAADGLLGDDDAMALLVANRAGTDALGMSDSVIVEFAGALAIEAADASSLSDTVVHIRSSVRGATDALGASDSVTVEQTSAGGVTVSDALPATDSAMTAMLGARSATDAIGMGDSVSAVLDRVVTVADFLGLVDAVDAEDSPAATPNDSLSATDLASWDAEVARLGDELLALTDRVTAVLTPAGGVVFPARPTLIGKQPELLLTGLARALTLTGDAPGRTLEGAALDLTLGGDAMNLTLEWGIPQ